ncbi:MAG: molybdopterin-synthase adenylyltransferase MoeB [Gammaproteobacteria bacterium]|nr:molybdopterin-synthase adenylyltransferase MoeB [Gammaproteobacteria bacterium]NIR58765.1 molybdopterin-synthase adenylyltransferase MoeB [Gammaproteobacteria bacterium]NIV73797.1 molybdopterin-synthase adenylyltransferase MoeB [Gammaproteobacteria bacterium]
MDDDQLLRYSRHIFLPAMGTEAQERLAGAHVLIVGLGGLGSPVGMYLAASGIGRLTLVDDDRVDLSNLQRQILHRTDDIGRPKVESAADTLRALNPEVEIETRQLRFEAGALADAVAAADLVADCSDNFPTRFALNAACVTARVPLVSGAAIRTEGQVTVFDSRRGGGPCYRCLYSDVSPPPEEACSENGILAPVVGIIGAVQAVEALKVLAGFGESLHGRLLVLDAAQMEWRTLRLRKDPECPVCAAAAVAGNG